MYRVVPLLVCSLKNMRSSVLLTGTVTNRRGCAILPLVLTFWPVPLFMMRNNMWSKPYLSLTLYAKLLIKHSWTAKGSSAPLLGRKTESLYNLLHFLFGPLISIYTCGNILSDNRCLYIGASLPPKLCACHQRELNLLSWRPSWWLEPLSYWDVPLSFDIRLQLPSAAPLLDCF